jgi:phosphatidylglycerol---prolipoprotein diacylglyceryl transferase
MIPYFRPEALMLLEGPVDLGPFTLQNIAIQPWGVMVAAAFFIGSWVCQQFAAKRGIDPKIYADIVVWMAAGALIFGHMGHVLYEPQTYIDSPIKLLQVWNGLSSMGGFFGCTLLAVIYFRRHGIHPFRGGDILMIGLAMGVVFGRLGCFIVHDHPGKTVEEVPALVANTVGFLAVDYPDRAQLRAKGSKELSKHADRYEGLAKRGEAAGWSDERLSYEVGLEAWHVPRPTVNTDRFDLGLMDALLALFLFFLLVFLSRKRLRAGTLLAVTPLVYMPVRLFLDTLRNEDLSQQDTRYAGFTPAQYGAVIMIFAGIWVFVQSRKHAKWPEEGTKPWEPSPEEA